MLSIKAKLTGERFDKQIAFAIAVALTTTAKQAQWEVIHTIEGTFTTRNNWYKPSNKFGIRMKSATKQNPVASLRTDADWLEPHEDGGVKTPTQGKELAIPTENVRRNKRQMIQKSQRPGALRGKRDFVLNTKKGRVLYQRRGKGKRSKIVALYNLEPRAIIRKHSTFFEPIERIVERNLQENFNDALERAYASANKPVMNVKWSFE